MGGVAGVRAFTDRGVGARTLCEMADLLRHRGPDESGVWVGPGVGIAHVRLGVIDVEHSHQPMHSADGRWVVAFAGEILNHAQLRATMSYPFRTGGDTEVILAGLANDGIVFLERVQGQFALVAHDLLTGSTHLVRDRLGVVPLYYRHVGGAIAFASEVKALLNLGPPPEVDHRSLDSYLRSRTVPAPDTMFDGVKKVRPAHRLTIRPSGQLDESCYWVPPESDPDGTWNDADAVEAVTDGVRESVRSALVSDVEVGAYLSGGLDSSVVVAQAQVLLGEDALATFSASFADPSGVVSRARHVGTLLGTRHHEVLIRPDDFEDLWGRLTWHLDAPLSDPDDVVAYALARAAGEQVRVVLSGDGGDEIFAGHPRHRFAHLAERGTHVPPRLRSGLSSALERRLGEHPSVRAAARALVLDDTDPHSRWPAPFSEEERARLLGTPAPRRRTPPRLGADPVDRMLRHDLQHHLPDHLLERDDRMAMAASVELRPALLDHRLVELAFRLPTSVKVRSGVTKWVLREAARSLLPADVVAQPRTDTAVPLDSWFRSGLRDTARERLVGAHSWVGRSMDAATVRQIVDRHDGGASEEARLWTLLCLERWHECFFSGAPVVPRQRSAAPMGIRVPPGPVG